MVKQLSDGSAIFKDRSYDLPSRSGKALKVTILLMLLVALVVVCTIDLVM